MNCMAFINDFLSLIYPRHCEACTSQLFRHETFICNACRINLPKSNYHLKADHELLRVFAGRVPLELVTSFYTYEKRARVQNLLHAIKYKGQKELGEFLGRLYAQDLGKAGTFENVDLLLPIPLHEKKLRKRGYNQSEWFARGLAGELGKPVNTRVLTRVKETGTQTRKKKYQRWENVEGIFSVTEPETLYEKHVLLVDDVITTGATIEAACIPLRGAGAKISVTSIAFAARNYV